MRTLFRGDLGHVDEDHPPRKPPRASTANINGVSTCLRAGRASRFKRVPRPSKTPNSGSGGLILLDAFLRPLNADDEAVSILTYPEIPRRGERFDDFLIRRIESLLPRQNGTPNSTFPQEVISGKRHYQLRVFTLKSHIGNGAGPSVAILLERSHPAPIDLGRFAQKFRLTHRETEALELLMQGHTTRQIACQMDISPNTAKTFLRSIMFKTGACDRSGVLAKILQFSESASE